MSTALANPALADTDAPTQSRIPRQTLDGHIVGRVVSEPRAVGQNGALGLNVAYTPNIKGADGKYTPDREKATYVDVFVAGEAVKNSPPISKGALVDVTGPLELRSYQGKDGKMHTNLGIKAFKPEQITVIPPKERGGNGNAPAAAAGAGDDEPPF